MFIQSKCTCTQLTAVCFLAALLMAALTPTTMSAQTKLNAQLAARALTQDVIGTYKLPATTERSAGLSTVGVGEAVYLEAQVDIAVPASQIADVEWAISGRQPLQMLYWPTARSATMFPSTSHRT